MSDIELIGFLTASIVIIIVPGVDFALVTRQTVRHGRRAGFAVLGGLFVAALVHASLATAGLSALLVSSPRVYTALRIAGALYLIYLGGSILWATRPRRTAPAQQPVTVGGGAGTAGTAPPQPPPAEERHVGRRSFTMGITSQLLNVKVVIFYVSFVPQFVTPGDGAAARTAVLAATFIGLAVLWWACYILLIDRLHGWLTRPAVLLVIERLTGVILIVLAVRIALSQ